MSFPGKGRVLPLQHVNLFRRRLVKIKGSEKSNVRNNIHSWRTERHPPGQCLAFTPRSCHPNIIMNLVFPWLAALVCRHSKSQGERPALLDQPANRRAAHRSLARVKLRTLEIQELLSPSPRLKNRLPVKCGPSFFNVLEPGSLPGSLPRYKVYFDIKNRLIYLS